MDPGGVARASPGGEAAGGRGRADEDRTSLRYFAPGILRREADNASYRVPLWRRGGGGRGQGGRDVPWADVLPTDASIFVGRGGAVGLRGGAAAAEGASQSIAEDWVPLVPGAMPRGRRAGLGASRIGDGGGGEGDGETVVGALMRETRELNAEVAGESRGWVASGWGKHRRGRAVWVARQPRHPWSVVFRAFYVQLWPCVGHSQPIPATCTRGCAW